VCRFCVEHGEGERWYLQAKNYAFDLESDSRRADYIVGFIEGFGDSRAKAITWMERLDHLPTPVSKMGKSLLSRHMQTNHFGQPVPIEECERILGMATSITVIPCICRMHEPGKNADEVCILVTTQPVEHLLQKGFEGYADGPELDDFRTVSAAEAMTLLRQCEEQGLMHSIWTFQTPFTAAICNCNTESGCMAMRLTAGYEMKMMWRGEWVVRLDDERCTNCRACIKLCPFDAIEAKPDGRVIAHVERCWGCGVCRAACRADALSLEDRRLVPGVAACW
jgi:Pyruvate/2-oxoacid:ferredoxin oxidoreductase delta subunit